MTERKKMRDASYKKDKEDLIDVKQDIKKKFVKKKEKVVPKIIEVDVNDRNADMIRNKKVSVKRYALLSLCIGLSLIALMSTSYAIFTMIFEGEKTYSMTIGTLDFEIQNEENSIRLNNAYPMIDSEGQELEPYTFTIKNTGTLKADYKISLIDDENMKNNCTDCSFLEYDRIKVELKENGETVLGPILLSDVSSLVIGTIEGGATNSYELRLWLDYENTVNEDMGKYYYGKISVNLTQEALETSSGSYINLQNGRDSQINQIKIYGNTEDSVNLGNNGSFDIVVAGKNLIKKDGYSTPINDTAFWNDISSDVTPLSDGWANVYTDNRNGTTNIFSGLSLSRDALSKIITNTKYTYYYEYENYEDVIATFRPNSTDLGQISYFDTHTVQLDGKASAKNVVNMISIDSFEDSIRAIRTYAIAEGSSVINFNIRAMILYGDVSVDDVGKYETYKERRYTINLIDDLGNVINGLGTGDILQKINNVYCITKSDGTMIDLSAETQSVLNNISIYEGISNIFIEEDIMPANMEITYLSK